MRYSIFLIPVFVLSALVVSGQSIESRLAKNIVTLAENKMSATDYTLLKQGDGSSMQIKTHAEAPAAGVMSRDNFVAMFSFMSYSVIDALKSGEGASTQDLDEPIGNVDLVINFYFSKNGIQVETKSGDAVDRKTMAWNEIFD
jgi:hypothetical protein